MMLVMKFKSAEGFSTITLVLAVSLIATLLFWSILSLTNLARRSAVGLNTSSNVDYLAESQLYATIGQLRQTYPDWPEQLPYSDENQNEQGSWTRTISEIEDDLLLVEIEASINNSKRRVEAEFEPNQAVPLDIILVIDASTSMGNFEVFGARPIDTATIAAQEFVRTVAENNHQARFGLVTYSRLAKLVTPLTEDEFEIRDALSFIPVEQGSNIQGALHTANKQFQQAGRPEAESLIVLFSDGESNYSIDCRNVCLKDACYGDVKSFAPDGAGTCCTNAAINQSKYLHSSNNYPKPVIIFGIYLSASQNSACGDIALTRKLGRETIRQVSSEAQYPETGRLYGFEFFREAESLSDISFIFTDIAELIGEAGFFEFTTARPTPSDTE